MKKLRICISLLALLALLLPMSVRATETTTTESGDIEIPVQYMEILPGNWSPLSDLTPEKEFLLDLTTEPLYRLSADGQIGPAFASYPVDVTGEYAGDSAYGVPAEAVRGYAFRIDLNENACWEDGTPITADDFLFTMEQLWKTGKNYDNLANAEAIRSGTASETGDVISLEEAGFSSVTEAQNAGYTDFFLDTTHFWGLDAGWQPVSSRTRLQDYAIPSGLLEYFVSPAYLYSTYLADGKEFDHWQGEFIGIHTETTEPLTYEDLGFLKTGEHQLTLVLTQPTTATALALELADFHLVRQSIWSNAYGTSAADYSAYGPYRVESASTELITLVRNENWYGQTDPQAPALIRCRPLT